MRIRCCNQNAARSSCFGRQLGQIRRALKKRTSHGLTLCAALTPASLLPVPRWGVGAALVDAANQGERRQTWLKRCDAKGGKPVPLDRAVYCLRKDLFVDIGGGP